MPFSSSRTWIETAGWLIDSSAAALEKLPSRATAWKILSWWKFVVSIRPAYRNLLACQPSLYRAHQEAIREHARGSLDLASLCATIGGSHFQGLPLLFNALRAAVLDGRVYQEIGEEPEHMFRAFGVVAAVALAFGLGIMNLSFEGLEGSPTLVLLIGGGTVMFGWLLWSSMAYLIGTRVLGGRASHRMLLRALGVAYAPGVLLVLTGVPAIGGTVFGISSFWMLASVTVAIRETQGYSWFKAFFPSVVGWFLAMLLLPSVLLQRAAESAA